MGDRYGPMLVALMKPPAGCLSQCNHSRPRLADDGLSRLAALLWAPNFARLPCRLIGIMDAVDCWRVRRPSRLTQG